MIEKRIVKDLTCTLIDIAKDRIDEIGEELHSVTKVLTLPRVWRLINHPRLGIPEKKRFIGEIIPQVSGTILTFLNTLLERERLCYLPKIYPLYERLADEIQNRVKVEIVSCTTLRKEEKSSLKETMRQVVGMEIRVELKEDPRLIGGIIARIGDRIIDGSVKTRLERLREELIK
ncbi:MAG: ATP synthase F1 subunit delta [bacterium]|nr:ATP synthase F1 subunit delta [bacterium]